MLKKTITYTDYNGVQNSDVCYFNLSKPELMEMERSPIFELQELLKKIQGMEDPENELSYAERDEVMKKIGYILRNLIMLSYGQKSSDGKRFIKHTPNGESLGEQFIETMAYEELYMELVEDGNKLAAFVRGIIPPDYADKYNATTPQITD